MRPPTLLAALGVAALLPASAFAAVDIKQEAEKVTVAVGGAPFTEYHFTGAPHVYYYPLYGPGGAKMTRAWPMEDLPTEEHDHGHHRSLWFAHGNVNGVDYWAERKFTKLPPEQHPVGEIVHEKFLEVKGGEKEGVIQSLNRWVAPDGSVPLTSLHTFRVYDTGKPNERVFDFDVVLTAGAKDAVMGDTKEGTMALRLAETMRVSQPKSKPPGQGHMVSSEGVNDKDVWGKRAKWIDYTGPVDGKTVGIAIFDHPSNPKYPNRWHARDYGLFAINPFCERDMDKTLPEQAGATTIPAGQSLALRYRFYIHEGDTTTAKVAERYAEYVK